MVGPAAVEPLGVSAIAPVIKSISRLFGVPSDLAMNSVPRMPIPSTAVSMCTSPGFF